MKAPRSKRDSDTGWLIILAAIAFTVAFVLAQAFG